MTTDKTLEAIDAAVDGLCACGCGPIAAHSPSAWFATETCQQVWMARQVDAPHPSPLQRMSEVFDAWLERQERSEREDTVRSGQPDPHARGTVFWLPDPPPGEDVPTMNELMRGVDLSSYLTPIFDRPAAGPPSGIPVVESSLIPDGQAYLVNDGTLGGPMLVMWSLPTDEPEQSSSRRSRVAAWLADHWRTVRGRVVGWPGRAYRAWRWRRLAKRLTVGISVDTAAFDEAMAAAQQAVRRAGEERS